MLRNHIKPVKVEQTSLLQKDKPRDFKSFNSFLQTVHKGDVILLSYAPKRGTTVIMNGKTVGTIVGKDFNDSLLKIWLGKAPVSENLKDDLLGLNNEWIKN